MRGAMYFAVGAVALAMRIGALVGAAYVGFV